MTCRHEKGDPNCSSSPGYVNPYSYSESSATTPDAEKYEIVDAHRVGPNLVLKVRYPNCRKCSYEGVKVMVYLNVCERDVIMWRKIDPHFTDPGKKRPSTEAPGPAARFPASEEGWNDAISYAQRKQK